MSNFEQWVERQNETIRELEWLMHWCTRRKGRINENARRTIQAEAFAQWALVFRDRTEAFIKHQERAGRRDIV